MNVGLPQEIFINDKPEGFAFDYCGLLARDVTYINVHCVVI